MNAEWPVRPHRGGPTVRARRLWTFALMCLRPAGVDSLRGQKCTSVWRAAKGAGAVHVRSALGTILYKVPERVQTFCTLIASARLNKQGQAGQARSGQMAHIHPATVDLLLFRTRRQRQRRRQRSPRTNQPPTAHSVPAKPSGPLPSMERSALQSATNNKKATTKPSYNGDGRAVNTWSGGGHERQTRERDRRPGLITNTLGLKLKILGGLMKGCAQPAHGGREVSLNNKCLS